MPRDLVIGPGSWDARVDAERVAPPPQPEDAFEARAVRSGRRSGIPAPLAQARVRRPGVHVAGNDVQLRFIALDVRGGSRVVDRIEHVKQFPDFVAAAQSSQRHDDPDGGMRVLASVLADTRRVPFDVPGILRRAVEWRIEQEQEL